MAASISTGQQILSNRGEFITNFAVSSSEKFKVECNKNVYHHKNNQTGVIDLSTAESHISAPFIADWMTNNFSQKKAFQWETEDQLYYPFEGTVEHLEKFADFINKRFHPVHDVAASSIVLGCGAEGVMESLAFALAEMDDYFLCIAPYYYNIEQNFTLRPGVKIWPVKCHGRNEDKPFRVDLKMLQDAYDTAKKTSCNIRGMILVNPNNPTGTIYGIDELTLFVEFCAENCIHLVVDEVYAQSVYCKDAKFFSVLAIDLPRPEMVHVLYTMSKDFGLSGLRVGLLISQNQLLLDTFRQNRQSMYSSVPTIIAKTSAALITDYTWLDNVYFPSIHAMMRENVEQITGCLDKLEIPYIEPSAGFFVWADFGRYIQPCTFDNELVLAESLVRECGVCLMPGRLFRCAEPGWFRLVITHHTAATRLATERLTAYLADGADCNFTEDVESLLCGQASGLGRGQETGLMDLISTLRHQIRHTDWLATNTADKWEADNPELATEFRRLRTAEQGNQAADSPL